MKMASSDVRHFSFQGKKNGIKSPASLLFLIKTNHYINLIFNKIIINTHGKIMNR